MKNKQKSIDVAMVTRKFYCHKCGQRLEKNPRTRLITRHDPEYKEYSRIGHTHFVGDVELTEYDFKCCACDRIIVPDEQYVIEKIQKKLGKHVLSDEEVVANEEMARASIEKKKKITQAIVIAVSIVAITLALYFTIKSGDFSFIIYL